MLHIRVPDIRNDTLFVMAAQFRKHFTDTSKINIATSSYQNKLTENKNLESSTDTKILETNAPPVAFKSNVKWTQDEESRSKLNSHVAEIDRNDDGRIYEEYDPHSVDRTKKLKIRGFDELNSILHALEVDCDDSDNDSIDINITDDPTEADCDESIDDFDLNQDYQSDPSNSNYGYTTVHRTHF